MDCHRFAMERCASLGDDPFQLLVPWLGLGCHSGSRVSVSMPVASAVQVMLQRAAARLGRSVTQRVIVANFEAALRVVRAGLAISLVPREVAEIYADAYGLTMVPMAEPWAQRRFIICYRDASALSPSAQLLAEHLAVLGQRA